MRGVGIETAKNIVLSGTKSLTIFDPNKSKINDLTSNFFLNELDVKEGRRRDEACISKLSELNPYVKINVMEGDEIILDIQKKIKDQDLKYDVVIITEFLSKKEIIDIDEICRKNNIGFILSLEFGIFGFIFVDFGDEFKIYDESGEETKEYLINSITKEKEGKVFINTSLSGKINLTSNDLVSFKEVEGMTELNNCSPIKIHVNGDIIEIGDTSNFSDYTCGGVLFNVKLPKTMNFESFKSRVEIPIKEGEEYNDPLDFLNINIQEILHIGLYVV
jgi:ubiquitin-activating enzyme E1